MGGKGETEGEWEERERGRGGRGGRKGGGGRGNVRKGGGEREIVPQYLRYKLHIYRTKGLCTFQRAPSPGILATVHVAIQNLLSLQIYNKCGCI